MPVHGIRNAFAVLLFSLALAGCTSYGPHKSLAAPQLSLSATSLNFHSVVIGKTATQTLHVSNTGTAPLTIHGISLNSQQFEFSGPSVPRTVLPSQGVDYKISFVPSSSGSLSASILLATNAAATPASISLAGVAEKAFAALQLSPSSINFGSLKLQSTETQNVTLQNTGDINLTINGLTVAGKGFGYSDLSPGYSLSPKQSVTFQVWFKPQTSGPASGTVSILSANLATPAEITVSGTGTTSTSPAPPPPGTPHKVELTWNPSTSVVVGYRVYRSDNSDSGFAPLTGVISELTYTDATVTSGLTYIYAVTSIDASGDESLLSNEATVVVPTS